MIPIIANGDHSNALELQSLASLRTKNTSWEFQSIYVWKSPVLHVFESSSQMKGQNEVGSWECCHLLQGMSRLPNSSVNDTP